MKIHFVGSEGVSMKALARISESYGHTVSGSDIHLEGHRAENIAGADLIVYTCAVGADNIEILEAKRLKIPTMERAEYLAAVSRNYKTVVAVAGSHGKTTATGVLSSALSHLSPTLHIGGSAQDDETLNQATDIFITEACEYKRSFLTLQPNLSIILNIELDHTDYYKDYDDYLSAFRDFISLSKTALINGDDSGCIKLKTDNCITFGLGEHNDYRAVDIKKEPDGSRGFSVLKNGEFLTAVHTQLIGGHNVYNVLASVAAADCMGADLNKASKGINGFKGMKRRFEFVKNLRGSLIYTDYAHHPSELKTTILSAREISSKKLTIIFEPHTFSRTKSLAGEFALALSCADDIILTPIFPAREAPILGVTAHTLKNELQKLGKSALYFDTFSEVFEHLKSNQTDGEIIVFTGAGDGILNAVRALRGE